ncbi:hypothetical protein FGB62_20g17 [Gracilaria domingensis]|nr:hypothetical protein FGB62_20g17 [Gracilaria domingensis]
MRRRVFADADADADAGWLTSSRCAFVPATLPPATLPTHLDTRAHTFRNSAFRFLDDARTACQTSHWQRRQGRVRFVREVKAASVLGEPQYDRHNVHRDAAAIAMVASGGEEGMR